MLSFEQMIAADASAFTALGESVVYSANGQLSTINAVIIRGDTQFPGIGHGAERPAAFLEAYVAKSDIPACNPKTDTITLAYHAGEDATARAITCIIDEDAGMWHLRLR